MEAEHLFCRTIFNTEAGLCKQLIQWIDYLIYASCYYLHFTPEEIEILMCNFHSISGQQTQRNLSNILRLIHHYMTESDITNIHSVIKLRSQTLFPLFI